MGDPKFSRRKYSTPSHPWEAERIKEELGLVKKYGLKNKREIWKQRSRLANYRHQARRLQALLRFEDEQAKRETEALLNSLYRQGIISQNATLNDVLSLSVENLLSRRLQTVVYMKGLAHTTKQARQLIVHGHISLNGRRITVPSYIVRRGEEEFIEYSPTSPLSDSMHPARPDVQVLEEGGVATVEGKTPAEKPAEAPADAKPEGAEEVKAGEKEGAETASEEKKE